MISLISVSPDIVLSGTAAAAITAIPFEKIFIDAAPIFVGFIDKIESLPGGESLMGLLKLWQRVQSGPIAWIFGDPISSYQNLGKLVEASLSKSVMSNLTDTVVGVGKDAIIDYATQQIPIPGAENVDIPSLTESRMLKLAGII